MRLQKKILLFVFVITGFIFVFYQNIKAETVPRMTFTNKETEMPDLYITKTVNTVNLLDDVPEDTEFTFEVKVDGVPYADQEYEVYAEDGTQVEKKRTDQNGEVVLKKDQKARFIYVGVGKSYEVAETSNIKGYTQIIPAEGSSYTGTITTKGAVAAFINEYIDPETVTELTDLKVSKRITAPAGYDIKNDTFLFNISLDGKKYANMEYEVYNLDADIYIKNEVTDENGDFSLNGGEYALFTDIETGIDYEIKESEKANWWSTNGNTDIKGVTQSVRTNIEFNNSQTSFYVTKKMDDGTNPDETFTFQLTDENNMVWPDASYYLYSTKGTLINDNLMKTDEEGHFSLKSGEAAVFVGIQPGTGYNIKEIPLRGYSQTIPSSVDGYTGKKVNSTVEELPFVNHEDETKGLLMVTKKIKNAEEMTPSEAAEFTFSINKVTKITDENNVETETLTPVKGASYEKNEGTQTVYNITDENGYFKLKAGETVKFTSLHSGEYQIEEITDQMPRNYYTDSSGRIQRKTLKLSDENGLYFEFENVFQMHKLDILIHKVSNTDESVLSGAVFRLYKDKDLKTEYIPEGEDAWNGFSSDENGDFVIKELPIGTYYLKEIEAPAGYGLAKKIHKIEIIRKGDDYHAIIDGIESSSKDDAVIPLTLGKTRYEDDDVILENDLAEYSFKNREMRDDCSIKITKYQGYKITLANAAFRLTSKDGSSIEKTTDEHGVVLFEGLKEGEYELTEIKTKSGLNLLSTTVKITLPYSCSVEDAEELKLDTSKAEFVSTEDAWFCYNLAYNISNTANLKLPQTGGNWTIGLIGFAFILLGVIFVLSKKGGIKNNA